MGTRSCATTLTGALLFVFSAGTPLHGQQFSQILIDGGTEETAYDALHCSDGSFVITGTTGPYPDPSADAFLLKLAPSGSVLWGRTIAGPNFEYGYRVKEREDGGLIMAGYTRSGPDPSGDILVVRTDANGIVLWAHVYGSGSEERCYDVLLTEDGGCVLTGGTYFADSRGWDAYLMKIDQDGDLEWVRTYGLPQTNVTHSISRTSDNGYLLVGWLYYWGFGGHDMMGIKTDSLGALESACIIGGAGDDSGTIGAEVTPGHYILAGMTASFGWSYGDPDIFLVGLDDFSLSWAKVLMDIGDSQIVGGCLGKDSSIAFTGWITDPDRGNTDILLIKCKPDGTLPLVRAYGGGLEDRGRSVSLSGNYGYVLAGFARRSNGQDVFVAGTDSSGRLGCTDYTPPFFTYNPRVYAAYVLLDTSSQMFGQGTFSAQIGLFAPAILDWCSATGVEGTPAEHPNFELTQNYPNPFNPRTWIRYTLERRDDVHLTVHDLLGRLITVLVDESQEAGTHEVVFDASYLPSGTYFYTLRSGENVHTKRMVIIR